MYGIAIHPRGWAVSIQRQGVTYKKAFFASTHGGSEAALARAQAWRDYQQARHPPMTQQQYARRIRQNNTSGHPGIICCRDEDGNLVRWLARTQIRPGLKLTRSFSVAKYGKRKAKMLAMAEREAQLLHLQGYLMPHPSALVDAAPADIQSMSTT